MSNSVFITGVAGFLGSHLADFFLNKGYKVGGVDNLVGGYKDNVSNNIDFHVCDLLDLDNLEKYIKGYDLVYHTACLPYEGLSVFSPSLISNNTYQITINAFVASIKRNVKKFVHCSSMARYGFQKVTPFTEDMVCNPIDPYGISKYGAELVIKNLSKVHSLPMVIAVPHNIIGPRQKYDDPFRNVASIMINLMMSGRQPVIYGDGKQTRCFSDIDDDIFCLYKFAEDDRALGEIFNIGPDEETVTIIELAELIAKILNFKLDPVFLDDRPQEVKHATCSADKIRKYFDYKTSISLEDSLKKMVEYIDKRGTLDFQYHLPIEIVNKKTPISWTKNFFKK